MIKNIWGKRIFAPRLFPVYVSTEKFRLCSYVFSVYCVGILLCVFLILHHTIVFCCNCLCCYKWTLITLQQIKERREMTGDFLIFKYFVSVCLWASTNKGKSIFVKVHFSFYINVPSSHILFATTLLWRSGATMYQHSREGKHRHVEDWLVFKWGEMVSVLLCLICTVKAYLVLVYALNSKQGIIMSLGILTVGSAGTCG